MFRNLIGAFQILTIIPVPSLRAPAEPGQAAVFFPFVGALLGVLGAGLYLILSIAIPTSLAALLTIAFWAWIGGALHEDGIADTADALRAGRTVDRMMAILKDSRIGVFGALALFVTFLIRWQSVAAIPVKPVFEFVAILVASQAVSRAALVVMAWISRPAGIGLAFGFCSSLTTSAAIVAILQGILFAFLCGARAGAIVVLGAYILIRILREWFYKRLGGITGDCLGTTSQIVECFVLLVFTCRNCIS